jgi:hypothetical protein
MKLVHWISIGLLAFTALSTIVFLAAPWLKIGYKFGGDAEMTVQASLWGQKISCDGMGGACPEGKSWHETFTKDEKATYCYKDGDVVTNGDAFKALQGAQAGAILALLTGIVVGALVVLHLFGKITKKWIPLIPVIPYVFFCMLTFGMFEKYAHICDDSLCERADKAGADSCGPDAGIVFVWFAMISVVAMIVLVLIRTPDAVEQQGSYAPAGNAPEWGEPKTQYAAGGV